jgi:PLP dependent protein
MDQEIPANLGRIREAIARACRRAGRGPEEVCLIAVSKTFPPQDIQAAHDAGQVDFGESRWQEAEGKLAVLPASIRWHFIGRLQRNKLRRILPAFPVLHAVDSLRLAERISELAGELRLRPELFLQVNLAGEESKGGFSAEDLDQALPALRELPHLLLAGLMTLPPEAPDPESARPWFAGLRRLRDEMSGRHGLPLPALSMGMSGDFEVAVEEGATHVRVGSSIFGRRSARVPGELG